MDLFFGVFILVLGLAAFIDFLVFKIPNEIVLFIIVLFFVKTFLLFGFSFDPIKVPLFVFAITLAVTFLMYLFRVLGAGDAKLIAAASLWVPVPDLMVFYVLMTLSGGALALIYLKLGTHLESARLALGQNLSSVPFFSGYIAEKQASPSSIEKEGGAEKVSKWQIKVPYGVAIFVGLLIYKWIQI